MNGTDWPAMAKDLQRDAAVLMDNLSAADYKPNKQKPIISPMFTPAEGFTALQMESIKELVVSRTKDYYYYSEATKNKTTWEEFCQRQPECGYPIRIPRGIMELNSYDTSSKRKPYLDVLQNLMCSTRTKRTRNDTLMHKTQTSTARLNILTVNLGNLERAPI